MSHDPQSPADEVAVGMLSDLLGDPNVIDLDRTSWSSWRSDLRHHLRTLQPGPVLAVVTEPLDREPLPRPGRSMVSRLVDRFSAPSALSVTPTVSVVRSENALTLICPAPPRAGGGFPWTDEEYDGLRTLGWLPSELKHQDLFVFVPAEPPDEGVTFLSDDEAERTALLNHASEVISGVYEQVLRHSGPDKVHVGLATG